MTSTARPASTTAATRTCTTDKPEGRVKPLAARALRIGGWANLVIAAGHVIGLLWAWSLFRAVGIEHEMRQLATQAAALPYIATLIAAVAFATFGVYGLAGAGDLRRVPLLRAGVVVIAAIFILRASEGVGAVSDGDAAQIAFAAISLLVGLCYAYGATACHTARASGVVSAMTTRSPHNRG
jgi:hypothetical protein